MKFTLAEPDSHTTIERYLSETGRWELIIWQVMYGRRVRLRIDGSPYITLDYCAGGDNHWQFMLFHVVRIILEKQPEEITERDLLKFFPEQVQKPMVNEPALWKHLVKLAQPEIGQFLEAWAAEHLRCDLSDSSA